MKRDFEVENINWKLWVKIYFVFCFLIWPRVLMAEGLYEPRDFDFPEGFPKENALMSIVKVKPKRFLSYRWFESTEEAKKWSKWITHPDGSQTIQYGVIDSDKGKCADPEFSEALFSHELCEVFRRSGSLPHTTNLKGNGNGFFVSTDGHILTNYHLVSGVVEAADRSGSNTFKKPIEVHGLDIEYPVSIDDEGNIVYKQAKRVLLVSNPSAEFAYRNNHDLALLKIDVEFEPLLDFSNTPISPNREVLMLGFTMRTARSQANKRKFKYEDADYDLRVSSGEILSIDSESTFLSSTDGGPGNSGSLTMNQNGEIVGIYYGSTGNGIVDPTGIYRRHVDIEAAKKLFGF